MKSITFFPVKSNLDRAYAAGIAMTMQAEVAIVAVIKLSRMENSISSESSEEMSSRGPT
jgi:hypothetical protein